MRPGEWQQLGSPPEKRPEGRGWTVLIIALVITILSARLALFLYDDVGFRRLLADATGGVVPAPDTAPAARVSGGERLPEPTPVAPLSTAPAQPALRATASPPVPTVVPTLSVLRLAVESGVYESYRPYFESLTRRFERLTVSGHSSRAVAELAMSSQRADAAIFWSAQAPEGALLLREEPYVIVTHPSVGGESRSLADWAAMALAPVRTAPLVTCDAGQAAQELLALAAPVTSTIEVLHWFAAKEYVATHPEAWAVVPWDVVNFRVRVQSVDGHRLVPEQLQGYPLVRRLWLRGAASVPTSVAEDLRRALSYEPPATVELVAVGDVMLGRAIKDDIDRNGPRHPFENEGIQPLLAQADIAFGNLECAVSTRGAAQDKTYTFRADPGAVEGLVYAGLDIVSLANNHAGDYGEAAFLDTLQYLRAAQIAPVGAGETITVAHEPKVLTINGLTIAFLAYNQVPPASFYATASKPGTAAMDPGPMLADVQAAQDLADVVVVSCHWGTEYTAAATPAQQSLADKLAEAGAALVIGHHPHVVQGLRYQEDTFTAYSLGNFVFDMTIYPEVLDGVALRCTLDAFGVKTVELVPYVVSDGRPRLLAPKDGERILQRIQRVTQEQEGWPKPVPKG